MTTKAKQQNYSSLTCVSGSIRAGCSARDREPETRKLNEELCDPTAPKQGVQIRSSDGNQHQPAALDKSVVTRDSEAEMESQGSKLRSGSVRYKARHHVWNVPQQCKCLNWQVTPVSRRGNHHKNPPASSHITSPSSLDQVAWQHHPSTGLLTGSQISEGRGRDSRECIFKVLTLLKELHFHKIWPCNFIP